MPRLTDRNQHNFNAHTAIYAGIAAGDPDAAENALRTHLQEAWKQVRMTFSGSEAP